ncbi:MAG: metal ABC transporter ATP-binding protein [Solirubrobacteraceae bacterium]
MPPASSDRPPLAEADGLAAGYGAAPVLHGVSFRIGAGDRVAVLGPNGGGKTTLFRVLLGELVPTAGRVSVPARCATVPQTERSRLDYPVSALDVALMGTLARLPWWRRPGRVERREAREALAVVGLETLASESFGELSGGQRQRVLIARALVQDARLLLLDEPFTGVDEPNARRLMALLDRLAGEGRAVMVATHDVEQARMWDLVLCLNGRQIAFGPPAETLSRAVLEATYGGAIVELPGAEGARGILPPHHHHHG